MNTIDNDFSTILFQKPEPDENENIGEINQLFVKDLKKQNISTFASFLSIFNHFC